MSQAVFEQSASLSAMIGRGGVSSSQAPELLSVHVPLHSYTTAHMHMYHVVTMVNAVGPGPSTLSKPVGEFPKLRYW